jgi:hypothetical protein
MTRFRDELQGFWDELHGFWDELHGPGMNDNIGDERHFLGWIAKKRVGRQEDLMPPHEFFELF